jgi:structural maintenance of chromosome 4
MAPGEEQLAVSNGAAPARRVMISRMVLDNFKSYAGPVMIGPFDSNMTSVVGPNGSGKSNVIDAMLFVFGFRAKQMRQGNVSELIHSSDQHPSLTHTRVSVHFRDVVDLEDGTVQSVEGSELVVAREARRDNSSTYWLDGKKSSRAEVTALLKERGIDLDHNRFLILQGEVEQIAMMKPKAPSAHEDGLLEYLEDIIGSNKLQQPINDAQAQVEALNESRASRLNSLKAVEQQMQALEPRKAEAEVYLKTEAELHERRSALYQLHGSQCGAVVAEAESKVEELAEQLRGEKEKAAQSAGELAELEKAFKKGKREHEKVVSQLDGARKQLQQYEREDVLKREEKGHLKAQIKKAAAAADKDVCKLAALEDELATLRADVSRLESESEAAGQAMAAAETELEECAPARSLLTASTSALADISASLEGYSICILRGIRRGDARVEHADGRSALCTARVPADLSHHGSDRDTVCAYRAEPCHATVLLRQILSKICVSVFRPRQPPGQLPTPLGGFKGGSAAGT